MTTKTDVNAFARMAQAFTPAERCAWNGAIHELQALADSLRDHLRDHPRYGPHVSRVFAIAMALPTLHDDGLGASWSPAEK